MLLVLLMAGNTRGERPSAVRQQPLLGAQGPRLALADVSPARARVRSRLPGPRAEGLSTELREVDIWYFLLFMQNAGLNF